MQRTVYRILLVVVAVALAAGVGELILRVLPIELPFSNTDAFWEFMWRKQVRDAVTSQNDIDQFDPVLGWDLKPNARVAIPRWNNRLLTSNSQGIRGSRDVVPGKSAKTRILALGDSFTFGECVLDDQTFSSYLENTLANTEVINMAVHGYGTDQILLKLLREGPRYRPDIVLLGWFDDDIWRTKLAFRDYAKPRFEMTRFGLLPKNIPLPPPDTLRRKPVSYLGLVAKNFAAALYEQIILQGNNRRDADRGGKLLQSFAEAVRSLNARLFVVYLPSYDSGKLSNPSPFYTTLCAVQGVTCVDPSPDISALMSRTADPAGLFACHYDPKIHEVIAAKLAGVIQKPSPQ